MYKLSKIEINLIIKSKLMQNEQVGEKGTIFEGNYNQKLHLKLSATDGLINLSTLLIGYYCSS